MAIYRTYPLEMAVLDGFIWFYMVLDGFDGVFYRTYPLEMEVMFLVLWENPWKYMGIPSKKMLQVANVKMAHRNSVFTH